jgi:hypothetical protein
LKFPHRNNVYLSFPPFLLFVHPDHLPSFVHSKHSRRVYFLHYI